VEYQGWSEYYVCRFSLSTSDDTSDAERTVGQLSG
jgi:hypothetical protein